MGRSIRATYDQYIGGSRDVSQRVIVVVYRGNDEVQGSELGAESCARGRPDRRRRLALDVVGCQPCAAACRDRHSGVPSR